MTAPIPHHDPVVGHWTPHDGVPPEAGIRAVLYITYHPLDGSWRGTLYTRMGSRTLLARGGFSPLGTTIHPDDTARYGTPSDVLTAALVTGRFTR